MPDEIVNIQPPNVSAPKTTKIIMEPNNPITPKINNVNPKKFFIVSSLV